MYFGLGILGLVAWIIIATWPARVASNKGYSWIAFFILSLFFWPITLIIAYVIKDRKASHVASEE